MNAVQWGHEMSSARSRSRDGNRHPKDDASRSQDGDEVRLHPRDDASKSRDGDEMQRPRDDALRSRDQRWREPACISCI
eukprot:2883040-Amphidinium_carterae.1